MFLPNEKGTVTVRIRSRPAAHNIGTMCQVRGWVGPSTGQG